ncbi:unnamed protein product [Cylindrotheca closterium]|uniref:Uncharacterized protein n=1 Tax=Cylindrotheca closterium TaxID=2856 RepID=A0AAD2JHZ6_9STRA|nr:unnamed protein product [Cylindrotheca closterium]
MSDAAISRVNHVASAVDSTVDVAGTTNSRAGESTSQPQHHSEAGSHHATAPLEAFSADSNTTDVPLPSELKRLLHEVAKTSACPWLSWDQEMSISVPPSTSLALASKPSARQFPRASQGPPRKKHRNGVHKNGKRRSSETPLKSASSRKRPLGFVRTSPPAVATNSNNISSALSSVGSGRTSGSEPDNDSTHYECDSEGTSTTSNSEMSVERLRKSQFLLQQQQQSKSHRTSIASMESHNETLSPYPYKTLQEAFRTALAIVLDHFYRHRGGYKPSATEKVVKWNDEEKKAQAQPAEAVYQQRRQRLLNMLESSDTGVSFRRQEAVVGSTTSSGAPFTIQRIAEVLLSPDRYYTQTHKLCNCLEKLLLVRSSSEAFGGSTGGDTSQSRREEREMAALADEKGRQDFALRHRRLKLGVPSPTNDNNTDSMQDGVAKGGMPKDESGLNENGKRTMSKDKKLPAYYGLSEAAQGKKADKVTFEDATREQLEAAARASLRNKFDHVGIDPHHHSQDRDVLAMSESRRMTNSPPPPSLAMPPAPASIGLPGHPGSPGGFSRQHHHHGDQAGDNHLARVPSPILFSPGNETSLHAAAAAPTNMHMLQIQHAVGLSGVSLARGTPSSLELMGIDGAVRQQSNLANSVDNTDGRSSASNSDVDSESDDISLDDSASDRSDSSDSGSVTHYEPYTAARAMALNRMQQQQRLHSRVLTSINTQQPEGFRLPADSEYQSGDSIDSTRAEDSGGSDSSFSDMAD